MQDPTSRRLVAALLLVYLLSAKGYTEVRDTSLSVQTAESIVTRGHLDVPPCEGATLEGLDGLSYSKYGIGLPLYFVPTVAVSHGLSRLCGLPASELTGFLISFANIPFALLTLLLFMQLLHDFGVARAHLWLLTLGLGLGTLGWRYACYDFSEAMQMGLLLLTVYGLIQGTPLALLGAGLGFAGLLLVKLVFAAALPICLIWLLYPMERSWSQRCRDVMVFGLPVLAALGLVAWVNQVRFGSILETGYGPDALEFHLTQLPDTLPRLLGSLDKGLFIFSPLLLLGLCGWGEMARRQPRAAALCGGLVLFNLVVAGSWCAWRGGWAWGPRLLVPALPLWLLPAGFWLEQRRSVGRFAIAAALTLASVVMQVPGVLVRDQQIHHLRYNECEPEEQARFVPDYPAAWVLLSHKLRTSTEIYGVSEFGVPGERQLDVTAYPTFHGLNLWTEHVARRFHRPLLRWLPFVGLVLFGWLAALVAGAIMADVRAWPKASSDADSLA